MKKGEQKISAIINLDNIKDIYGSYLENKNYISQIQRRSLQEKEGGEFYRPASWAGHCVKKHKFLEENAIPEPPDRDSLAKLRLGTLLHYDILGSLMRNSELDNVDKDIMCLTEIPVVIDSLGVRGSTDVAFFQKGNADVKDFKSMAAYPWKKKFGLKKNREENPSKKYEFQIGTYGVGIETRFGVEVTNLDIIYYKKDSSAFKSVNVPLDYMEEATDYWIDVNRTCKDKELDEMIPGTTLNVPVEQWECNYCPFAYLCNSPFIKRKE